MESRIKLTYTSEMDVEDSLFNDGNEDLGVMARLQNDIVEEAVSLGFNGKVEIKQIKVGSYLPESVCYIYKHKDDVEPYEKVTQCHTIIEVLESLLNN